MVGLVGMVTSAGPPIKLCMTVLSGGGFKSNVEVVDFQQGNVTYI